ncbi:hypothetical protein F4861DRAFT_267430 [Xylaria intraflava]|nr:hypothetical protein F4861DRAFT_267430 [Xylaria intraflava]
MVSFFGLKIGGEKKKKSTKDAEISTPQTPNYDPAAVDDEFLDFKPYEASIYSLSRQDSGLSTLSKKSKLKGLKMPPFASKFGSSMVDLPQPPALRHHVSNPSFGRRWNTGSTTSLGFAPPPSFAQMARPSTSDGEKIRVNPLGAHSAQTSPITGLRGSGDPLVTGRDGGPPSTPSSAIPKSPLGQYELKLDLPSDFSSFADFGDFGTTVEAPAPLRIKKQASTRLPHEPQKETQPLQKPPTPPQSINDKETVETPASDLRPPSASSHRSIPPAFPISKPGPTSLPSPSTTPRASEEKSSITSTISRPPSRSTKKGSARPVIQNVRAKRDTLTINMQRRRSLQMKVEAAEKAGVPLPPSVDRPKTSNGRPFERPPPLTLNTGFNSSGNNRKEPRSAFLPNPPSLFTPISMKSPLRTQVGTPGQSNSPAPVNEVDSPTGSSIYNDDGDDGESNPPESPESTSPVIPLTGPLASPRFPPSSQSPYSYFGQPVNPWKDAIDTSHSRVPAIPPIPPRSLKRNPPTYDSGYCPSPSPLMPSFDRAAMPPSPADSRLRSGSESESLYARDPLEPPRIPAARSGAGSPTLRSFSRPRTPAATGEFTAPPIKRTQTAGHSFESNTGRQSRGGLKSPPRPVRAKTETSRRPPARAMEKNMGAEFI